MTRTELPPLKMYPFILNCQNYYNINWLWWRNFWRTVKLLKIETNRSEQTVQTLIRLLQKEQSDQGLHCLELHLFLWPHYYNVQPECFVFQGRGMEGGGGVGIRISFTMS